MKNIGISRNLLLRKVLARTKGWGQSAKLGPHSAIWGKLGTALQAYTLNPCAKFPPNPKSRKVNTDELADQHQTLENMKKEEKITVRFWGKFA